MTGPELKAIRRDLGDTVRQFALRLGYRGSDNTNSVLIREYERGKRPIPDRVADRARAMADDGTL